MSQSKRTTTLLLSIVILMTHFVALLHTINHDNDAFNHEYSKNPSLIFDIDHNSDSNKLCDVCDVYLDSEFDELKNTELSVTTPTFIIDKILQVDTECISYSISQKQSRAPPIQTV